MSCEIHTIILVIVNQLVKCDHVHQANDTAVVEVLCCGAGQHGDGTNTSVETGSLLHTHCRT
jgi:hypothetical protein